ncbi:MAG TPA: hypothetical protein VE984_05640 [Gaiellaceae bacterium]|nr:hypothetical protein [Gaiellaceae bacterium]
MRPAKILATIPMPNPSCCGVGQQAVWGLGHHNDVLYRIDPNTNRIVGRWRVADFQTGIPEPQAGAVWIPSSAGQLIRFDPISGHVVSRIPIRGAAVQYAYEHTWETTLDHTLVRIDIQTDKARRLTRYAAGANDWVDGITYGAGDIWIGVGDTGQLLRVDPTSGRILHRIFLGNTHSELVAVYDDGAVWAFRFVGGQQILFRIDPATNAITARIPVGPPNGSLPNGGIAAGDGYIWTCDWDGKLSKVDERTNRVFARYTIPSVAENVTFGDGSLWAAAYDASEVYRIDPGD